MQTTLPRLVSIALICATLVKVIHAEESTARDFDRNVAPLIAQRCLSCHSGTEPKGMLDLSTRATAMSGGETGRAIEAGQLEQSLLWQYVDSDQMPPKKPLSASEKAIIKAWISEGAHWGAEQIDPFRFTTDSRAGIDWWSLQPIGNPEPSPADDSGWSRNSADAFVVAKLRQQGLTPTPEADRRTLIRRLSFDLLGLPPTLEQIETFLADTSDLAYENLVDRFLESPHYGERWARHWLDVVRFGESNGFEYDEPRNNFWHYRNWVIHALNEDLPYDEFVRLQLAGDVLQPNDVNAAAAAGFLVAGPHNTTLPANQIMRMTMAQDELEDLVGTVGQTFLGLTVNCARCHDHKFDPISQKEYYQLAATLAGVTHGERKVHVDLTPEQQRRIEEIDRRAADIRKELDAIEQPARDAVLADRRNGTELPGEPPKAMATWEFNDDLLDRHGALDATANGGARLEDGFLVLDGKDAFAASKPIPIELGEKTLEAWVQLNDLNQSGGGVISIQSLDGATFDAIVFGEREPGKWMAGSNGFIRTLPFHGVEETDADKRPVHVAIVWQKDGTITGYRDGQQYGEPCRPRELQMFPAGKTQVIFGLRHGPPGGNRMLAGRIQRAQLYDHALTADEISESAANADTFVVSNSQMLARLSSDQRQKHAELKAEVTRLQSEQQALLQSQERTVYTCISSEPGIVRVLRRGNVTEPAEEVLPSGLSAVTGMAADFGLAANAQDADRRKHLAAWITRPENPLFARVMVNRIWQYHFGQGLVTTPSDFGFNGGQPSHPELLDWLAELFRAGGYRLKPIHRVIVTSATWRQGSAMNAAAASLDADNRLLWRRSPQRLEAEEIRDAALVVTNQLNAEIGGMGYRDVRHYPFKGSNFYESINESGQETHRRTIYRFTPRGGRNPFLDTFDCPDPSATAPKRATTTTPLQALALMNDAMIFEMADEFSKRAIREAGERVSDQVRLIYEVAYGREANDTETQLGSDFIKEHSLPSYCRVILNSNEFLYVR